MTARPRIVRSILRSPRRLLCRLGAAGLATIALCLAVTGPAAAQPERPTVVLVHGAFADASSWTGVITRLQRRDYQVVAPANPLRGLSSDTAYLKRFLATIDGPVVLVGHSYGGAVITNAATGMPNVRALVYVAAYAPDQGDTLAALGQLAPGGMVGPATLTVRPFPGPDGSEAPEGYIKAGVFRRIFAADLPAATTDAMAAAQRPVALGVLTEPSGPPAWRSIPSWYQVAGADHAIGTRVERIMARRIKAKTTEVPGASHVVMISRPDATTRVILAAARATG
jgi:pimeloyl-ACP methyl ester carboxylesterase